MPGSLLSLESDPDLGFIARMMVLCSLPRTNPGEAKGQAGRPTVRRASE